MRCLLLLVVFGAAFISASMQNITFAGEKRRMSNAHVQLYDKDTLDPNDLLAEVHTDKEGNFELFGQEDEVGKIEPFIRISHNCKAKTGCTRVGDYTVPQHLIGSTYDMTYVTLDIVVHGEKEKC